MSKVAAKAATSRNREPRAGRSARMSSLFANLSVRLPERARERANAFAAFVWRRFVEDRCFESAGALSYATVFAMVPLSAAVFGILSAFPIFEAMSDRLTGFLFRNFVPQAAQAVEIYLHQFAASATRLTSVGAIALLASALLVMKSIEDTFDRIWRVGTPRPGMARFLVYWTALTLGPILAVASLTLSSYLISLPLVGGEDAAPRLLSTLPVVVELSVFTLAYMIVPNRRVALRHALFGGMLATALFELAKWGFGLYLREVPSYQQIYGTLAIIPIFLIWIYLSWVVILLGASIVASLSAFRFQPAAERVPVGQELFALLRLISRFAEAQRGGEALEVDALRAAEPSLGDDLLLSLLDRLEVARIVQRNDGGDWLLARDLDQLSLGELYEATGQRVPGRAVALPATDDALGRQALAIVDSLRAPLAELLDVPLSRLLASSSAPAARESR